MKPSAHPLRRLWILALIPAAIAMAAVFSYRPILVQVGSLPILEDRLESCDLIVVMSGGLPDIHYGVDLYQQGYASKLLFVGHFPVELAVISKEPFEVVERPWDEIAGRLAVNAGVSEEKILYSNAFSTSTYERVQSALEVAREHDVKSVIFVGHLIHSRRVKFSANRILSGSPLKVISAPTPPSYFPEAYRFDVASWWTDESDLRLLFGEYIRLVFYLFKYGLAS
jgi:uncharacterized SAM-binding protein YcdF (DUF218 family)